MLVVELIIIKLTFSPVNRIPNLACDNCAQQITGLTHFLDATKELHSQLSFFL